MKLLCWLIWLLPATLCCAQYVPSGAVFPVSGGGGGSFAVVHATACSQPGGSGAINCTVPATAAGDALLALISDQDGHAFTVSGATAWAGCGGTESGTGSHLWPFTEWNIGAGTTSITITDTTGYNAWSAWIIEMSHVATSAATDGCSAIAETSYGTSGNTGYLTTTNANDAVFGVGVGTATFSPGSGYTGIGTGASPFAEYLVVSSATAYNPSLSWSTAGYAAVETFALKLQ